MLAFQEVVDLMVKMSISDSFFSVTSVDGIDCAFDCQNIKGTKAEPEIPRPFTEKNINQQPWIFHLKKKNV